MKFNTLQQQARQGRRMSARYDAADTTVENSRTWANSNGYAADLEASPAVRRTLRNRSRYEVANNSDLKGLVRTVVDFTVGTGPRLQMLTDDSALNDRIEKEFAEWAWQVRYADSLRVMREAKIVSGEAFMVFITDPTLNQAADFRPIVLEADYICTPWSRMDAAFVDSPRYYDGIHYDDYGNEVMFDVLKRHPGAAGFITGIEYDVWPARSVQHYFRQDRPGQRRGVPEITPALPLFVELRRYELAVLAAAETAADFAMFLYTEQSPDDAGDLADPFEELEIRRRMMTTLPAGYKVNQTKAEQPTTTFKEFRREILGKAARCLDLPMQMATLDSAEANMSSRYIDGQIFEKSVLSERMPLDRINDHTLDQWLTAWIVANDMTWDEVPPDVPHMWFWPEVNEHADPEKVASANETAMRTQTVSLAEVYARRGLDWEKEIRQIAKEKARLAELGLTIEEASPAEAEQRTRLRAQPQEQ